MNVQLPSEKTLAQIEINPGDYTLLFESDSEIFPYHWCDFRRKHEETGQLLEDENVGVINAEENQAQFSKRYRLTLVPIQSEGVQILKADNSLAQTKSLQVESKVRAIADINGKTVPRARFNLRPSLTPSEQPITKFGGQPVWIDKPQWPIGRTNGKPMQFIGQIALDSKFFGDIPGKMAYIFMSAYDDEADKLVETWSEDSGDNAVVIQPGGKVQVKTEAMATGPSVPIEEFKYGYRPVELVAELIDEEELFLESFDDSFTGFDCEVSDDWSVDKIGGTPVFIQSSSSGSSNPTNLILQMHEPEGFYVNFGTGQAHVFLSEDGQSGYMFWQTD